VVVLYLLVSSTLLITTPHSVTTPYSVHATISSSMSHTVHYSQISEPHLLDIVDEAWRMDKLPDDSEWHWQTPGSCCTCSRSKPAAPHAWACHDMHSWLQSKHHAHTPISTRCIQVSWHIHCVALYPAAALTKSCSDKSSVTPPSAGIPLPPGVTQPTEDAEDPHQQQQQQQQQQVPKPEDRWGELGLHHAH
jgi:hypothetical protein